MHLFGASEKTRGALETESTLNANLSKSLDMPLG